MMACCHAGGWLCSYVYQVIWHRGYCSMTLAKSRKKKHGIDSPWLSMSSVSAPKTLMDGYCPLFSTPSQAKHYLGTCHWFLFKYERYLYKNLSTTTDSFSAGQKTMCRHLPMSHSRTLWSCVGVCFKDSASHRITRIRKYRWKTIQLSLSRFCAWSLCRLFLTTARNRECGILIEEKILRAFCK